jgi:hypothetical protein
MQASSIIVLGGPSAGKTVYLAALYHHLWKGYGTMVMRAGDGATHSELLRTADEILSGRLPPATQALRHYDFELEHNGRRYNLHYLDYPGELFRKVFYEMAVDGDEARQFHEICAHAAGVVVLLDPKSIGDITYDVDYAISNLLRYYRAAGSDPKFVMALTKRDENHDLVKHGVGVFLKCHLPHTARLLGRGARLMHFSSILKSPVSIFFTGPDVVTAPLGSIIAAIDEEVHQAGLARVMRRATIRAVLRGIAVKVVIGIVLLVATVFSFVLGIWARRLVG